MEWLISVGELIRAFLIGSVCVLGVGALLVFICYHLDECLEVNKAHRRYLKRVENREQRRAFKRGDYTQTAKPVQFVIRVRRKN